MPQDVQSEHRDEKEQERRKTDKSLLRGGGRGAKQREE